MLNIIKDFASFRGLIVADRCSFTFPLQALELNSTQRRKRYLKRVKEIICDPFLPVEILDISKWFINEIVVEYYSNENV